MLRFSVLILSEATAESMSVFDVGEVMAFMPCVCEGHNMQMRSLGSTRVALSADILHACPAPQAQTVGLLELRPRLAHRFGIAHGIAQIDGATWGQGTTLETGAVAWGLG